MTSPGTEPTWRRHSLAAFGLTLDVFDGPEISEVAAGGVTALLQQNGPVRLGLWVGPGMDLAGWRARLATSSPRFGAVEPALVCGRGAERQEALVQTAAATGVTLAPSGEVGRLYETAAATAEVAVAFEHGGRPVLLGWSVEADHRRVWQAAEERFFASIRCP